MSLEKELQKCKKSAEVGYQLASRKYSEIRDTLREEEKKITETNRKQNELSLIQNSSIVEEQIKALTLLKTRVESIGRDIIALHAQQKGQPYGTARRRNGRKIYTYGNTHAR